MSWPNGVCLPSGGWSWVLVSLWAGPCLAVCLEVSVGPGIFRHPSSGAYRLLGGARS